MNRPPTSKVWIVINVILPLVPFLLGGMIRFVTTSLRLSWSTFSASEMAICLGLLSLFLNQSLVRSDRVLDNKDKQRDVATEAAIYLVLGVIFIALFALITAYGCIISELNLSTEVAALERPLRNFELIVFAMAPFMIAFSIQTQRSYRLKASLI